MPFRPPKNLPTFSDLKITLAKSDTPDNALYQTIQTLIDRLEQLHNTQAEIARAAVITGTDPFNQGIPEDVTGFILEPFPTNLRASWDQAASAAGYELHKEAIWTEGGPFVASTPGLFANIDPIVQNLIIGSHTFAIKAVNFRGQESVNAAFASITVPSILAPVLSGSGIANNALLSWSTPVSMWRIRFYNVFQNGVQIAQIDSNFMIASVLIAGTYNYTVQAVDIVGNLSAVSPTLVLELDDPIDLFFVDSILATLNGTYVRTRRDFFNGLEGVLGPINDTETWQTHFTSRGWNTIQDQINAGFPVYIQPTATDGYYQEQFDFGVVRDDITVIAAFSKFNIIGNTQFSTEISYSADNVTYTPFAPGPAVLAASIRYARVKWIFTNTVTTDLGFISGLKISLSTQLVLDSGAGHADKNDINGTIVLLNKVFLGINSVTMTSDSVQPITLVFDETTTTTFKVFAFDAAGRRVTCDFTWKVRGVI